MEEYYPRDRFAINKRLNVLEKHTAGFEALTLVASACNTLQRHYDADNADEVEYVGKRIWRGRGVFKDRLNSVDDPNFHSRPAAEDGLFSCTAAPGPNGSSSLPAFSETDAYMNDVLEFLGRARARLFLLGDRDAGEALRALGYRIAGPLGTYWVYDSWRLQLKELLDVEEG